MNDLLKELKLGALDWKGFLLAGLFPVIVFYFGAIFCLKGPSGVEATLESCFRDPAAFAAKSAALISTCLIFGLLLYALRPVLLNFYRRIPIPILRGLMVKGSAWRRDRADERMLIALWRIDVAHWLKPDLENRQYVVLPVLRRKRALDLGEALEQSKKARSYISDPDGLTWWTHKREVFSSAEDLHILTSKRTIVEEQAAKLSGTGRNTSDQNWADAENFLGIKAPDDRLSEELEKWRVLLRSSALAQERARTLDNYLLYDRYRKCALRRGRYPNGVWIEATRLGNIFAALEDYAADRYGMDTALLWSRLEAVVPQQQREQLANYQRALSSMLHLNFALWMLAVFAAIEGFLHHDWKVIVFALCSSIAAQFCLSAAEYSAAGLGDKIAAAVDLNILRWLRALGLVPTDVAARMLSLRLLGTFFNGGTPLPDDLRFAAVAEPSAESKKKED